MRTLFAVTALVLLAATTMPVPSATPVLDIHVEVYPSMYGRYQLLTRSTPDTYTCSVTVTDPDAKRAYAHVELIARPGVPAETTKVNEDYEVHFNVEISKAGDVAKTNVSVRHGGRVVARQSSIVRLLKTSENGYKPAQ